MQSLRALSVHRPEVLVTSLDCHPSTLSGNEREGVRSVYRKDISLSPGFKYKGNIDIVGFKGRLEGRAGSVFF